VVGVGRSGLPAAGLLMAPLCRQEKTIINIALSAQQ
jgi:hypothetical protein